MEQRPNRGRARGRARPVAEQQAGPGPAPTPRPAGAWGSGNPMRGAMHPQADAHRAPGPAPAQPPRQPVAWGPSMTQQAARPVGPAPTGPPPGIGRPALPAEQLAQVTPPAVIAGKTSGGSAGGDVHSGRGAFRGRRPIPETAISTRMQYKSGDSKQGNTGKTVTLQTNYFRIEKRPDWCLFQYRVDFSPEIDVTAQKKRLYYNAISKMNQISKGVFDGTVMYSTSRIHPDPLELIVDSLHNPDEKVRITIRMVGSLDISSYQYLQVFNLIVRKCMGHLKLQPIRRDYFDPNNKIVMSNLNMELWPGMVTSIRQHEKDILMCAEIKHKIMKTETAWHVMKKIQQASRGDEWKERFQQRMLNVIVLTDYNNKTYNIDDVEFDRHPDSAFTLKDGSTTTFRDYYNNRYAIKLKDMTQPLLVTKVKARELRGEGGGGDREKVTQTMLLIPELCRMTGLTEEERTNRQIKDKLEQYMMPTPTARINHLRKFNERLQTTPGSMQEMSEFDLRLSKDILSLTGRHLPMETLWACNGKTSYSATDEADWTRNMRGLAMYRTARMDRWVIVYGRRDKEIVQSFYNHMVKAAAGMQWSLTKPVIQELPEASRKSYEKTEYLQTLENLHGKYPDLTMCVCIVPSNRSEHHSFIKKRLTVEKGIPSQVITTKTCSHKSAFSIATKVIVQMNSKLGGAPWAVNIPLKGLMICGYDVCHDPKNKGSSYGAFVASYDARATAYYNTVASHPDGEELSNFIAVNMVKACAHYLQQNGALPAKILFFRDGVGDGQLNFVYEHELKSIYDQLNPMYAARGGQKVRMRVILVNKRINTRFFFNGGNPLPGTVVDDVVTLPDRSDFYLISQCTRKGTVSPTYYSVLGPDDFELDTDKTQQLTHRLCHQYYNWGGTVRVPAPCQYAHKLAFLAAQSLQRSPNENLNHLLHFL